MTIDIIKIARILRLSNFLKRVLEGEFEDGTWRAGKIGSRHLFH
jgi:hypothetical protein